MKTLQRLLVAGLVCVPVLAVLQMHGSPLLAQSLEPFNPYGIFSPGVEAWQMTRYGNLTPSLYTGAMTFSLPLYTYEDLDFTIPISLEYSFDGYRPGQHSGTVGYGWYLNCGGVITREVRGMPDEGTMVQDGLYYHEVKGWPQTGAAGLAGQTTDIYSVHRPRTAPLNSTGYTDAFQSYDPFTDCPVIRHSDTKMYDLAPDLFHFSYLGHNGSFLFDENGTAMVLDSDLPEGTMSVCLVAASAGNEQSYVTIKTGDGYSYVFIPDGVNLTTPSQTMGRALPSRSITAFRLTEVKAPNGRRASFSYRKVYAKSAAIWYTPQRTGTITDLSSPSGGGGSFSETAVRGCNVVEEEYSALESVRILSKGGEVEAELTLAYVEAPWNEFGPGCFIESELQETSRGSVPQQLLSMVNVINRTRDTVERVSLDYIPASSGVPKSFLHSVSGRRTGRFTFNYNLSGFALPSNDTQGVDHWGFWNGRTLSDITQYLSVPLPDTYPGSLYSMVSSGMRDASATHSGCGALTRIAYPTGGWTDIGYEPNTVRRRLDLNTTGTQVLLSTVAGGSYTVGGVRVASLTDTDKEGRAVSKTFDYVDEDGLGTGILMRMPAYVRSASYVQRAQGSMGVHGILNCYVTMSSMAGFDPGTGGSVLSQDSHVAYTSVKAVQPDGSYTRCNFSSVADPGLSDTRIEGTHVSKRIVSSKDELDSSNHGAYELRPVGADLRYMRGKPVLEKTFTPGGRVVRSVEWSYEPYTVTAHGTVTNCTYWYAVNDYSVKCSRLANRTECLYGQTLATQNNYNSKGQLQTETVCNKRDTVRTYYHYYWEGNDTTRLTSVKDAAVRTRKSAADGVERIIAAEDYTFGDWTVSCNPKPTAVTLYPHNGCSAVQIDGDREAAFATGLSGGARTTTITYDDRQRIINLYGPGGATVAYTWEGCNPTSVTYEGIGNTSIYEWRDLVGPTAITASSGRRLSYGYDDAGRLEHVLDGRGSKMIVYNYKYESE